MATWTEAERDGIERMAIDARIRGLDAEADRLTLPTKYAVDCPDVIHAALMAEYREWVAGGWIRVLRLRDEASN